MGSMRRQSSTLARRLPCFERITEGRNYWSGEKARNSRNGCFLRNGNIIEWSGSSRQTWRIAASVFLENAKVPSRKPRFPCAKQYTEAGVGDSQMEQDTAKALPYREAGVLLCHPHHQKWLILTKLKRMQSQETTALSLFPMCLVPL